MMIFCKNCILPDTRPNLIFNNDGVCNACLQHNSKNKINWKHRERQFLNLVKEIKKNNFDNYDCLIPVSGGKDSTWQVIKCLEYGLKPLAVTWKTPGRTVIGQTNLNNLINLGVDHIDYQINPIIESKLMLEALKLYGATAIPMHMALFNIPMKLAIKFQIPLIIYGENSAQEYGGNKDSIESYLLDKKWYDNYGVTNGTKPEDWISNKISRKDLSAYLGNNWNDVKSKNIRPIFLGHFFKWDTKNSFKISKKHGFKSRKEGPKVGIYNHTDIDCDFISVHHWLKWYKFGFTRDMDNLSIEIRNKRVTRLKALKILKQKGIKIPKEDINSFCKFVKISNKDFNELCEKFRNKKIWKKTNKNWTLNNFIIKDWAYS